MTTYAIGDLQGCLSPLRHLLDKLAFDPASDALWFAGDLVNRGPESVEALRFVKSLGDTAICVLGNHDLHFLALYHGCTPDFAGNRHTLEKLLAAPDCAELARWLRHKPLAHYDCIATEQSGVQFYLMVHAGLAPQWSLRRTMELAAEVEIALKGPEHMDFLRAMYGDTPSQWHHTLSGYERLRVITNYLTRLRFCNEQGVMNLQIKEAANKAPEGFKPWFHFEQITPATNILFGHWAALEGVTGRPQVYALDTGCVWGRELSMMRLEDHKLFSV